ncbi:MAG: hypothetical protein KBT03_11295 [Bacteroidales bacterium]|nr:hypothetical protein [Candidatus Scybalousia scybalohippi]
MCGLAGIITTEKEFLNLSHFDILGSLNDERGGDSCGIFIDGFAQYGIGQWSDFRDFTNTVHYPTKSSIALVHCRKASVGYPVTEAQAQPIIIKNDGKIEFVLMHNGTITNSKVLAKKYLPDMDVSNMSDSQIMANIFYQHGYDVLNEYEGTAVFIFVDYRGQKPSIKFFKGNSTWNPTKENSERPLFYMKDKKHFYFSSMYCSLRCISHHSTIYTFPVNSLIELSDNTIHLIQEYDRTKLKITTKPATSGYSGYWGYPNYADYYNDLWGSANPSNQVKYHDTDGLYYLGDKLAHGEMNLYDGGSVSDLKCGKNYYFYYGRLLYNKACYDFLEDMSNLFVENDFVLKNYPAIIDYFSYNIVKIQNNFMMVNSNFEYEPAHDTEFYILFDRCRKVTINESGWSAVYSDRFKAAEEFKKVAGAVTYNFDEIEESIVPILISIATNETNI